MSSQTAGNDHGSVASAGTAGRGGERRRAPLLRPAFWLPAALLLSGWGSWLGLQWLRAPSIRARIPDLPDLRACAEAARKQVLAADLAARRGLPSARRTGQLGQVYHGNLLYPQALVCYRLASELDGRDSRWPYYAGLLAYEQGMVEQALTDLQLAAKLNPDYPCAWVRLGDTFLKLDRLDEALDAYRRVGGWQPYRRHALLGEARVAERRKDWRGIARLLRHEAGGDADFGPGKRLLAAALNELGRTEDAARVLPPHRRFGSSLPLSDPLVEEIERQSCSSTFLLKQATLAARQGRFQRQIEILHRLTVVAPDDPDGFAAFAGSLRGAAMDARAAGREQEASQHLRLAVRQADIALRLAPGLGRAHLAKAMALELLGDVQGAVAHCKAATETEPLLAEAHRRLGVALVSAGKPHEAERRCRRAIELEPYDAGAHDSLGYVLARAGKWDEAVERWEHSRKVDPDSPIPLYNIARALARKGERAAATRVLRDLLARLDLAPAREMLQQLEAEAATEAGTGEEKGDK